MLNYGYNQCTALTLLIVIGGTMNEIGLIFASHGDFAKAALASAEMIAGKQENVIALALELDSSADEMEQWIKEAYDKLRVTCSEVVILCDIYGGTPFNAINKNLIKGMEAIAYTGLSLPLVIDLLLSRGLNHDEITSRIEETHKLACMPILKPVICEENDDFDL